MTNNCQHLDANLDGELAPGERWRFAAHLDGCPTCREAVDEQQWIDGLLRAPAIAQRETPPVALVASFRAVLARRLQYRRLAVGGIAAAAAVVLVAAGWTVTISRQADEPGVAEVAKIGPAPQQDVDAVFAAQSSTFVGDSDQIVVPIASRSPNVTIVRVYPVYQPNLTAEASVDDVSTPDEFAWPESFRGG